MTSLDLSAAFQLGVELGSQQDHDVGDPQPGEEGDHAPDRAVGLVVRADPPGLTQWNFGCFTFGAAQKRIANMKLTISTSTGHLAMSQAVTAAPPRPTRLPTCLASGPVTTTATAQTASRIRVTIVMPTRTGNVFQIGRPSPTS